MTKLDKQIEEILVTFDYEKDDYRIAVKQLKSLIKKELVRCLGKDVSSRTWNSFFKGTTFEKSSSNRALDIKCAYTNGFNQRGKEALERMNEN